MAINLILQNVSFQESSMTGDVAVFRYTVDGEGVDTGTIEIVVPWTGDLGAAQTQAQQQIANFSSEFAKATGSVP